MLVEYGGRNIGEGEAEDGTVITSLVWDTDTSVPAAKAKGGKGGKKNR